mmetsp:Transcript_85845/g.237798  ORF Transcript_85845/g.237798 Transcript_85845/m.237798 type:complete len:212 (-) Transcript_85845:536-1171(-)
MRHQHCHWREHVQRGSVCRDRRRNSACTALRAMTHSTMTPMSCASVSRVVRTGNMDLLSASMTSVPSPPQQGKPARCSVSTAGSLHLSKPWKVSPRNSRSAPLRKLYFEGTMKLSQRMDQWTRSTRASMLPLKTMFTMVCEMKATVPRAPLVNTAPQSWAAVWLKPTYAVTSSQICSKWPQFRSRTAKPGRMENRTTRNQRGTLTWKSASR